MLVWCDRGGGRYKRAGAAAVRWFRDGSQRLRLLRRTAVLRIVGEMTRDEIVRKLDEVQDESGRYWGAFDAPSFFARLGDAWSPAENVRHLVKSIRPVTKALKVPRILLRLKFGKPDHPSATYDALVERYHGLLAAGGNAGRFAPSPREERDLEARREEILAQHADANRELRATIVRWSDAALDRDQLPHPLLGNLTIREMLYFTLYHQLHHIGVVERRLGERRLRAQT